MPRKTTPPRRRSDDLWASILDRLRACAVDAAWVADDDHPAAPRRVAAKRLMGALDLILIALKENA